MRHPVFPTRKASKLTFVCFQLQFFSPCNVLKCQKEFFAYFNALETRGDHSISLKISILTFQLVIYYKKSRDVTTGATVTTPDAPRF